MKAETRELGGGITLHALKTDKFKTDSVSVNFVMPFKRETVTRVSLLRGLLLRGCEGYPTFEKLSARTDELYGAEISIDTSSYGDVLVLTVSAVSLAGRFSADGTDITGGVFDLLRRICFFPLVDGGGFSPEYTKSEKQRLKDEIEAKINNKGAYAQRRLSEEMFGEGCGAISKLGYAEDLEEITPVGAYLFYRELVKTCPIHVYTVGSLEVQEAEYYATTVFDGVEREASEPILAHRFGTHARPEPRYVLEQMDVKQGKLAIGYRTSTCLSDAPDYAHMLIANEIFGVSPVSKLFMHVREELNLCYYCQSSYRSVLGAVTVSAGIDGKNIKKTLNAINEMLECVKNGDFDEGELEIAKKSLISAIRTGFDSPRYITTFMLARMLCGVDDTPEELWRRIAAAQREDVCRAARTVELDTVYFLCPDREEAEKLL
ncbi:MAG: insulinase family protein [Ruminococcaceae bacterium]|nr:insulinase family protein [Oscillospiraceae bacterium]